mmetsp:Transcript_26207/g.54714  ORF Transcript_26207/g.54714 Transcript_26207/m.54714 type:complete len:92 (+) Transcript_26207:1078-1353(+)
MLVWTVSVFPQFEFLFFLTLFRLSSNSSTYFAKDVPTNLRSHEPLFAAETKVLVSSRCFRNRKPHRADNKIGSNSDQSSYSCTADLTCLFL